MSLLDGLIDETARATGLGDGARKFVAVLAGYIFTVPGGFNGFRDKFAKAGLGEVFDSWMGNAVHPRSVSAGQVQHVIGNRDMIALADKAGVGSGAIGAMLATVLPMLVRMVTPGGALPTAVPNDLQQLVNGVNGAGQVHRVDAIHHATPPRRARMWKWLLPLLVLLGLGYCGWQAKNARMQERPAAAPAAAATPVATPAAASSRAEPQLDLRTADGKVNVSGRLPSVGEKHRLLEALGTTFGTANVVGDIQVDPATQPAGWMDKLIVLLPRLKANGLRMAFNGDRIDLDTSGMPQAQRFELSRLFQGGLSSFELSGLFDPGVAALDGLTSGYGAGDLTAALNQTTMTFESSSATLSPSSREILRIAAKALAGAPDGTHVLVGGHTDSQGDPAANLALSQQRAQSVVDALVALGVPAGRLTAQGHGSNQPIADNRTDEGRAANRRIAYTVK
jgi:outer membrane protein OmpA-like peptidoglycan-associated protein/uncharacterized protein YidB (DUF937 family)